MLRDFFSFIRSKELFLRTSRTELNEIKAIGTFSPRELFAICVTILAFSTLLHYEFRKFEACQV